MIAVITIHAFLKLVGRKVIHQLREYRSVGIHTPSLVSGKVLCEFPQVLFVLLDGGLFRRERFEIQNGQKWARRANQPPSKQWRMHTGRFVFSELISHLPHK